MEKAELELVDSFILSLNVYILMELTGGGKSSNSAFIQAYLYKCHKVNVKGGYFMYWRYMLSKYETLIRRIFHKKKRKVFYYGTYFISRNINI